jgi:hypothetical protein
MNLISLSLQKDINPEIEGIIILKIVKFKLGWFKMELIMVQMYAILS